MPATSKREFFVATAYTESHFWKLLSDRVCSRSLDPSLIEYYFTITIQIASSINRIKLNKMTVACVKLKVTFPNIVIRGGSGTPAISKMELFVAIALHWKPLTFVVEGSILDRRQHAIQILDPLVKYDFTTTVQTATSINCN